VRFAEITDLPCERVSSAVNLKAMSKAGEIVMQIPVAIAPTPDGGFRAESLSPLAAIALGSTREEAVAKVRDEVNKQLEQGKEVVMVEVGPNAENPWLKMAGWLKDDPLFDEWREAVEDYRRQCDIEAGIEYHEQP
jgi:predicted RNase H-like HicB family nuclease